MPPINQILKILPILLLAAFMLRVPAALAEDAPGQYTNAALSGKVKQALDSDPDLKKYDLDVSTHNGVVRLDGIVLWPSEKERAVKIASGIDGFNKIENVIYIAGVTGPVSP